MTKKSKPATAKKTKPSAHGSAHSHQTSHTSHKVAEAAENYANNAISQAARAGKKAVSNNSRAFGQVANLFNYNYLNNPFNNMFSQGTKGFQDSLSNGAEEAKKVHERVLEFGRGGAQSLARSADSAAKGLSDAVAMSKENFEAIVESANIASKVAKNIGAELSEYTNNLVADNFRAFEEFLSCKTVSDFLNLHSSLIKSNVDACFNESLKLTELAMEMGKAAEPISQQMTSAAEKLTKSMAA